MRTTNQSRTRRRGRAAGVVAVAVLAALTGFAAPAVAQEYPPTPIIVVDKPIVPDGDIVTISGDGYLPNAFVCSCILRGPQGFKDVVQLTSAGLAAQSQQQQAVSTCQGLGGTIIGSTTSDDRGTWSIAWDTSRFPEGDYVVAATDGTNTLTVDVAVTPRVDPSPTTVPDSPKPGPQSAGLPQTGGIAAGPLRVGAILLAVGGIVVLAARNRRPTAHARGR